MSKDPDRAFFGHTRGLSTLFFTEMWERLSYYGGRARLTIYMTTSVALGGRGMSLTATGTVMALYLSSVYLLSLPGGWVADRFLGQRRSVTIGGIGIAAGNAMLAGPDSLFFPGLVTIALGAGIAIGLVAIVAGGVLFNAYVTPIGGDALQNVFGVGLIIAALGVFAVFYKSARDHEETPRVTAMIPLFVGGIAFFTVF